MKTHINLGTFLKQEKNSIIHLSCNDRVLNVIEYSGQNKIRFQYMYFDTP